MQSLPEGAMLAVPLPVEEIAGRLVGGLALAAVNGPSLCVVAGPTAAVTTLREELARRGVDCRRLHTSHAFHSSAVEPVLDEFTREVRALRPRPGNVPYISNLTGTWQTAEGATDPAYWARHMRQTVLFGAGLEALLREPEALLLEVGPGDALASLARRHPARRPQHLVMASMRHPSSQAADPDVALGALANLWLAGAAVDWQGFHRHAPRQRVVLPTYPFERQRYWVERGQPPLPAASSEDRFARRPADQWLYSPEWVRSRGLPAAEPAGTGLRWLLLIDELGWGEELARSLTGAGAEVVRVRRAEVWSAQDGIFTVVPGERSHYARLAGELAAAGWFPDRLVHLWSLTETAPMAPGGMGDDPHWFYGLLFLAEAFGRQSASHPLDLIVVTHQTQAVSGEEPLDPAKAALLGPCKVIPQEYPDIRCRLVDVSVPPGASAWPLPAERLLRELLQGSDASVVALRGASRWAQTFEPLDGAGHAAADGGLRRGGVYLITGGLGRIGLELATDLARSTQAKLVLLGRSPLPPRVEWEAWIAAHDGADSTRRKLLGLTALERDGAEVLALAVDVADGEALSVAVAAARARFGVIHGVFHAAGSIDDGALSPIQNLTAASCAAVFRPKLGGLAALAEVFRGQPPDFLVAFSSLSTVLGGLGYAAYAAANACMDALVHELSRTSRIRCLSVDWDAWRFAGEEPAAAGMGSRTSALALSPTEGIAALKRILALRIGPQVVVSTSDLQARIDRWVGLSALRHGSAGEAGGATRHARPGLTTPFVAPRNELEAALADSWQELLGIAQVGIHDNFFDLGGHSLLGIQLNARLRRMFEIDLPLRALFDSPTIAELAEVVESALIGDLDELSEEQAELLVNSARTE